MSDPRFAKIKTDPRFRKLKRKEHKVVLDDRFKDLFQDDNQKIKGDKKGKSKGKVPRVDKYGRRVSSTRENENLRRFYRLEGETDSEDEGSEKPDTSHTTGKRPDFARGEALLESSEEDDGSEDDEESASESGIITLAPSTSASKTKSRKKDTDAEIDLDESQFATLDAQATSALNQADEEDERRTTQKGSETSRLAVVNMDWDHVKASHLFKVFQSAAQLAPTVDERMSGKKRNKLLLGGGGKVLSVRVYPSEFGKARLVKEEAEGPPKEVFTRKKSAGGLLISGGTKDDDSDEEDVNETTIFRQGDAEQYDMEALRTYQLERLRYFYAVVTCDSPATAMHIYTELDGTELERSANVFDLSYVPAGMTFDEDGVRDEATQELGSYKAVDFVTDALRHSKVKLTWDDDDPNRMEITRRTLTKQEIEEGDFKAYIASSSSSDSEGEAGPSSSKGKHKKPKPKERDRLRALLLGDGDGNEGADDLPEGWGGTTNDKAGEMEITFTPGLSAAKGDADGTRNETTLERYLKKQKEKRAKRKAERTEKLDEQQGGSQAREKRKGKAAADEFFSDAEEEEDDQTTSVAGEYIPSRKAVSSLPTAANDGQDIEPKHFDMRAVLKAEKEHQRKGKKNKKKKPKDSEENMEGADFAINVADARFTALHEEHEFAIDPSNPHYKPTQAMKALLSERSKRLKDKDGPEPTSHGHAATRKKNRADRTDILPDGDGPVKPDDLKKLVESVKRKSTAHQRHEPSGKRRKLS